MDSLADDFRTALTLQVPKNASAGRLSDSGSDMGDSDLSSGRGGSDPGTVLPKISIMSLGMGEGGANMMGANDARTTGDSRSAAGSSDIQHSGAISVSSLSYQDHQSELSSAQRKKEKASINIQIMQLGSEDADTSMQEEQKRPA